MTAIDFRAMNTDVHVELVGDGLAAEAALASVEALFAEYERTLSRFDPTSDLCRLNRAAGAPWRVSPLLFRAVRAALIARAETGGLFDPTFLPELEAAGYDRSFDALPADCAAPATAAQDAPRVQSVGIDLDEASLSITLPAGVRLDLGGIGKGMAVDAAAALLTPFAGFVVDAGGDIRAGGGSPEGGPWYVALENPLDQGRDLGVLAIETGAVATSSVARRRWRLGGVERHHLIDPRTGTSAASDVLAVTVLAPSTTQAEVFAKAALIAGSEEGLRLLESEGLSGLLVLTDGALQPAGDFCSSMLHLEATGAADE